MLQTILRKNASTVQVTSRDVLNAVNSRLICDFKTIDSTIWLDVDKVIMMSLQKSYHH